MAFRSLRWIANNANFGKSPISICSRIFLILFSTFLTDCKPISDSKVSGVPTEFYGNKNIDLTVFTNATEVDYHNMLKFLNASSAQKLTMEMLKSNFQTNLVPQDKFSPLSKSRLKNSSQYENIPANTIP